MKVAKFRVLVLEDFAEFVFKNCLLDRHRRAIGRGQRPAIMPVADVESQLCNHELRPLLSHFS